MTKQADTCYTVILSKQAGSNIGIVKRGSKGYFTTDYNFGTGDEATEAVRFINDQRGVDEKEQLEMEMGSMFIWNDQCDLAKPSHTGFVGFTLDNQPTQEIKYHGTNQSSK